VLREYVPRECVLRECVLRECVLRECGLARRQAGDTLDPVPYPTRSSASTAPTPTPTLLLLLVTAVTAIAGCAAPEPELAPVVAAEAPPLEQRLQGAQRVVVGAVERVSAAFGRSEHGDSLILSTVLVRVRESLRGERSGALSFVLEGGTVGAVTLRVSDLPALAPGDHGLFALRADRAGRLVPNRRGLGVLLLREAPDLAPLRRAEEATR